MILGIGIDTVEIDRFAQWYTYAPQTLARIFSHDEIEYCLKSNTQSAQRFAVRFAAREALYKALSYAYPDKVPPFLTLCAAVVVQKIDSRPFLVLQNLELIDLNGCALHLSLTHSRLYATALVIIETK